MGLDSANTSQPSLECNEANVQRIREAYIKETKDEVQQSKRSLCLKLIVAGATEKDQKQRLKSAHDLSEFLTSEGGVLEFVATMIDFDQTSQKTTTLNQRFLAIAKLITCSPGLCMPYSKYCENISKQIRHLLHRSSEIECTNKDSKLDEHYTSLACNIIEALMNSPYANENTSQIVLGPIISSFKSDSGPLSINNALVSIHNLLQNHLDPKYFIEVFPNLFHANIVIRGRSSKFEKIIKKCLVCILDHLEPGLSYCLVETTITDRSIEKNIYEKLCNIENCQTVDDSIQSEINTIIDSLISILAECDNEHLALECFFNFHSKMLVAQGDFLRQLSATYLLHQKIHEDSNKLNPLNCVATNCSRSLNLISRTLLNYIEFLQSLDCKEEEEACNRVESSIGFCVSILEVLAKQATSADEIDILHKKVLPALEEIRDLVNPTCANLQKNICSLLEELESSRGIFQGNLTHSTNLNNEYDKALVDLNDKLPPVRVHALVRFKQLVMSKDNYTISRIPQLYSLVESSLHDKESYVYLACINLLSIMCVRNTRDLLPQLLTRYSDKQLVPEQRVKFGEVLVKLAKNLNTTTPHYGREIMLVLLESTRDSDELIRMSSLTNIGEICRYLGHSLGRYVLDILQCVEKAINEDTIQVKCAAIDLLGTALMGLDKFNVESVQRELKLVYSLLKKLRQQTLDEKLTLQIDRALGEVDRLARSMLGLNSSERGDDTLIKNIKVLSLLEP